MSTIAGKCRCGLSAGTVRRIRPPVQTRFKICCIQTPDEARLAIEAGASALGLVRVATDAREHLLVVVRRGERMAARLAVHADRHHALHAGLAGARNEVRNGCLAVIEVAVGVDHRGEV